VHSPASRHFAIKGMRKFGRNGRAKYTRSRPCRRSDYSRVLYNSSNSHGEGSSGPGGNFKNFPEVFDHHMGRLLSQEAS